MIARQDDTSPWRYSLYWLGMLTACAPIYVRLVHRNTASRDRIVFLVLLAAVTYLPRLLRSGASPFATDELLHWYQLNRMDTSGSLFNEHPMVAAITNYPGFEAITAGLHWVTGLSLGASGLVIVGIAHVALILGIYFLVIELVGNIRAAGVAAVIYAAGPGFTFFTVLLTYQSLGLPLMVWSLLFVVRSARSPRPRWGVIATACTFIVALAVTHVTSTFFLVLYLAIFVASTFIAGRRERARRAEAGVLLAFLAFTLVFNVVWACSRNFNPITYLLPTDSSFWTNLIPGGGSSARIPFDNSGVPLYERLAGAVAPVIIMLMCAVGFRLSAKLFTWRLAGRWALATVFVIFPMTFLGVFSATAAPWVHRPWPFLYVGMSVLAAAGFVKLADEAVAPPPHEARVRAWVSRRPTLIRVMLPVAIAILFIGNTSGDSTNFSRFPGRWIAGADTRSSTPEVIAAADWLLRTAGPGARVIADKDAAVNLMAYGQAYPIRNVAIWEITENVARPMQRTLADMYNKRVEYIAVDFRMATTMNIRGYWYVPWEPEAGNRTRPIPYAAVSKLQTMPWASRVYASENLRIYRIDRDKLAVAAGVRSAGQ
jgi:hypothetical protein